MNTAYTDYIVTTAGHWRTAAERERERETTPLCPGLGMFGVWRPGSLGTRGGQEAAIEAGLALA